MARSCRLVRDGRGVEAMWRRDGDALVVAPAGSPAVTVPLAEVSGIAGDGFTVRLRLPDGEIALERLGGDGPTLLAELWRDWPVLRAAVLRLAGAERPAEVFCGTLAAPWAHGPFRGFPVDGRLVVAPEGGDVFAVFIADYADVAFDEQTYAVRLTGWGGEAVTFRNLGAATAAFAKALQAARETLAIQAGDVTARYLPTLAPGPRAALAATWLPGRLLSFAQLERLAPGFETAFRASWLAATPRVESGVALMEGLAQSDRSLGYAATSPDEDPSLWLLACSGDAASFELLSHGDYATYLFRNGVELRDLVEGLIRLPEFSREALYLPLEEFIGDRGVYAIPARDLPLLRNLRSRFTGRKIHSAQGGQ